VYAAFVASLVEENGCVPQRDGEEAHGVERRGGRRTLWSSMLKRKRKV